MNDAMSHEHPGPRPLGIVTLIGLDRDIATIVSAMAVPAGSRVSMKILSGDKQKEVPIHGKVIGISRDSSGFRLRIRLHDLTREHRSTLSHLVTRP